MPDRIRNCRFDVASGQMRHDPIAVMEAVRDPVAAIGHTFYGGYPLGYCDWFRAEIDAANGFGRFDIEALLARKGLV